MERGWEKLWAEPQISTLDAILSLVAHNYGHAPFTSSKSVQLKTNAILLLES